MLQQLLPDPLGPRVGFVDLIDGHNQGRLCRFGVANRLDRLLHDAVIGRHDQHHDVGDIGAARAHRSKSLMTRRVDKGDLLAAFQGYAISADMLSNAAGFASCNVRLAQRIEERSLPVIDMTHDRDYRSTGLERIWSVLVAAQTYLDIGFGDPPQTVTELGYDHFGGVGVDDLINRRHHAHAH